MMRIGLASLLEWFRQTETEGRDETDSAIYYCCSCLREGRDVNDFYYLLVSQKA
jgi:hypothetical protein